MSELLAVQDVLDAVEGPTCAVDPTGVVLAVNAAWLRCAVTHGGDTAVCGVGADYFAACDLFAPGEVRGGSADADTDETGAVGTVGETDAVDVATGLRAVLAGDVAVHRRTYACHGPEGRRWFTVRIVPLRIATEHGAAGTGALVSHSDVSLLRRTEDALTHQAQHDALTGLPNRVLLTSRLSRALARSRRDGTHVAVGFLDLDRFKRVNDSLGHASGDALLVQIARRLRDAVREHDTLARYAGDEFIAVWVGLDSPEQAVHLGRRVLAVLEQDLDLAGRSVRVGASVGVAVATGDQSAEELLLAADTAMYDAKRRGGGGVSVFTGAMRSGRVDRLSTEVDLRLALDRDELVLHYQPVVDLQTGRPVAVEALARWQHPRRGLLGPDRFIEVAEDSGLIVALGRWALDRACRDAADPTGPMVGLDVAVNLSARQLADPEVVGHVRQALDDSGLDPGRLLLEVTESAVVEDERAAALALEELAALGVGVAVDDFGTGWSSMLYLRRYPVSTLKIDRGFVAGLGRSPDDEAICASIVSLAQAVGATCIAEGVETVEQYATLRGYGCSLGQGFVWSPAVALHDLPSALAACAQVAPGPATGRRRRRVGDDPLDPLAEGRIRALRLQGASLLTIAGALNREQVLHPAGVRWTATSVARYLAA